MLVVACFSLTKQQTAFHYTTIKAFKGYRRTLPPGRKQHWVATVKSLE